MNCKVIILFLFVQLTLVPSSATVWQVYLGSNFFAPESLVVASGDTVVWTNLEGTHNIVEQSVPPLFTSGAPAPPPWSYAFVFSLPLGSYSYHCDVHAPEMSGYVTVIPYGTPPNIGFDNNYSVPQNAHVGWGFRMTVRATDEDQDLTGYALSFIDTNQWSDWSPFPAFLICDTSLGLFPENTTLISNSVLADGTLDIYFRAIDSRQFVSPIILRTIVVEEGHRPVMDTTVTGTYAENYIYPDGSVYFLPDAEVALTFRAYPPHIGGEINGYRLRDAAGIWSEWFSSPTVTFTVLPSGEYPFRSRARCRR